MFGRQFFGNPFQPFAPGLPPLAGGTGFSGITPLSPQIGGFGPGIPQSLGSQFPGSQSLGPQFPGQQFAGQQFAGHQFPGQQLPGQQLPGWINPLLQAFGPEAGYPGFSPFSSQFGWGGAGYGGSPSYPTTSQFGYPGAGMIHPHQLTQYQPNPSPFSAQESIINPLLAQQLNPLFQQRLPIRSLVNPQQIDPYQAGLSGLPGSIAHQATDPYSTLVQAQLMSQLGAIPFPHLARGYTFPNWF
jgi:hypothetical protein